MANKPGAPLKSALTKKNLIGYAMGDLGGCMTFAILGSFLTPYYTEVAGLTTEAVAAMYIVLKIWDAINDPMMGALMDKVFAKTHSAKGKFRPWMLRATPLLLIASVLMYTAPTYASGAAKVLAAFVTYLLYEASYTMFNIPYGSLLSAMSDNDAERANLSSARGFGSMIGNLIPMFIFPIIISATTANPQMGYTVGVTVCALIGFVACLLSCKWTCERNTKPVTEDAKDASDIKFSDILVVIKKNRAFDALCLQGLFFCISQYMSSTLGVYMYRDVLGALPMMSMMTLISMAGSFVSLSVAPKVVKHFGLERTVRGGQLIGIAITVINFICMLTKTNVFIYMILSALAACFTSLTVLMQWGMVGEAIDYNEYLTGKRTEGSIYGTFNLMRRVGQAVGSSVAVALLGVIGYVPNAATQTAGALLGIKVLVVLMPAVFTFLCWCSLRFVWNITPEIRAKMSAAKTEQAPEQAPES